MGVLFLTNFLNINARTNNQSSLAYVLSTLCLAYYIPFFSCSFLSSVTAREKRKLHFASASKISQQPHGPVLKKEVSIERIPSTDRTQQVARIKAQEYSHAKSQDEARLASFFCVCLCFSIKHSYPVFVFPYKNATSRRVDGPLVLIHLRHVFFFYSRIHGRGGDLPRNPLAVGL